jgi:hypothetical protein
VGGGALPSSQLPSSFDRKTPRKGVSLPVSTQKKLEISPLFKSDSATRPFYASKDGKITVNFSGWEQNRVVLEGAKPLR